MKSQFLLSLLASTAFALPASKSTNSGASKADDASIAAAHHVIYSYTGADVPQDLLDLTKQGLVGGVILFGDNVASAAAASSAMAALQSAYAASPQPTGKLLILTDQEGGSIKRVPGGPDQSEKEIGESSDPAAAAATAGQQSADTLKSAGVNGNLSPVLDVFRTPGDFDDKYERSYSNDSAVVATCGAAFVKAQQAAGVAATAKHFPGLGAATADQDTDARPVTLDVSADELQKVDVAPYKDVIQAGVDVVMTSWALYPSVDPQMPAGLSRTFVQDWLRGQLGFQGVTCSDSIEAGGLDNVSKDDGERSVLASKAGLDIILAANRSPSQGQQIVQALVQALQSGLLVQSDFDAATQRIIALKNKF